MNGIELNKKIYQKVSERTSRYVTHKYSTSFSLSIYLLHKNIRGPIRGIYGFVRLADELVDTFHEVDQKRHLDHLREQTFEAIQNRYSSNPILYYFQEIVHQYNIERDLIDAFFQSMEMDLGNGQHNRTSYDKYIYGSAEVVGLMCLHVFCEGDNDQYRRLKPYAIRLGAAYQKVNFLRDIGEDVDDLHRSYFPQFQKYTLDTETKRQIEEEIEHDFDIAYQGIVNLPLRARLGVYVSYLYYRRLLRKIKKTPPDLIMSKRIRISNFRKGFILCEAYIRHSLNRINRNSTHSSANTTK